MSRKAKTNGSSTSLATISDAPPAPLQITRAHANESLSKFVASHGVR